MAVAGLVPVFAGLAGVVLGRDFLGGGDALSAAADGHVRYLSGLLLGIGLGFWSAIPGIEAKGARFRLLGAIVVLGGLARLYGFARDPDPQLETFAPLVMELVVTPALVLWRERLARRAP